MNDQILLDNYLLNLKSTVEVYVHGTQESSNDGVRTLFKDSLDDTLYSQSKTYDRMVNYGWYQVNNVDVDKLKQTLDKINSSN